MVHSQVFLLISYLTTVGAAIWNRNRPHTFPRVRCQTAALRTMCKKACTCLEYVDIYCGVGKDKFLFPGIREVKIREAQMCERGCECTTERRPPRPPLLLPGALRTRSHEEGCASGSGGKCNPMKRDAIPEAMAEAEAEAEADPWAEADAEADPRAEADAEPWFNRHE